MRNTYTKAREKALRSSVEFKILSIIEKKKWWTQKIASEFSIDSFLTNNLNKIFAQHCRAGEKIISVAVELVSRVCNTSSFAFDKSQNG